MSLDRTDKEVFNILQQELQRQRSSVELIASENFASQAVMAAQGSVFTNKYAEGYSKNRYYQGCAFADEIETLAIARAKKLFNASYANVQPHSGSQANQAVFLALLEPGDTILSMALDCGGHLTHGAGVNLSGKWFNIVNYKVDPKTYLIDYNEIEKLALEHKPKLIIAGYSAYSRSLDFQAFRTIADKVGAYLLADMAHISGLVATSHHQSPINFADVVTSTTHKTLRGPRSGIILSNSPDMEKKLNSGIFPGLQGGPLMHVIAAKAIAFEENLDPSFTLYIEQVIKNSRSFASALISRGLDVLTGGTDNHMFLVDLRRNMMSGKDLASILEQVGITCNKNSIPFDKTSPFTTSGIRLGTAACTTRGFKEAEFRIIANIIADIIESIKADSYDKLKADIKHQVAYLLKSFPLYPGL